MARKKRKKSEVCSLPGKIDYQERKGLPSEAFALPRERKYPLYVEGPNDTLVPSPSHARNALSRASQQFNRGTLTESQYQKIQRKARKVLRSCEGAELHLCDSGTCYRV